MCWVVLSGPEESLHLGHMTPCGRESHDWCWCAFWVGGIIWRNQKTKVLQKISIFIVTCDWWRACRPPPTGHVWSSARAGGISGPSWSQSSHLPSAVSVLLSVPESCHVEDCSPVSDCFGSLAVFFYCNVKLLLTYLTDFTSCEWLKETREEQTKHVKHWKINKVENKNTHLMINSQHLKKYANR